MIRESSNCTGKDYIFKIHETESFSKNIHYISYTNIVYLHKHIVSYICIRQVTCYVFLWPTDCVWVNITQTPHKQYHKQCENVYVYKPARSAILPDGFYNIPRNTLWPVHRVTKPKHEYFIIFIFCFGHFITASTFKVISSTQIKCIQ